jgi:hypothetical protein
VSKLVSRGQERYQEVELLGKDEKDPTNGGNHPWSLEDGNESTLLLFNHSSEPENFSVSISNGDQTWQKVYELSPMQTEAISFSRLIQDQAKDDRGKTLPRNSLKGQVTWFTRVGGLGKGRLLLSNRDVSVARNFSCASGFALCGLTIYPGVQLFSVGSTVNFGTAQTEICDISGEPQGSCGSNGVIQNCPSCRYGWTSNGAAASISGPNNTPGVSLTGNSAGTSNINLNVLDTASACQYNTNATATVTPSLTSISPARGLIGTTLSVTLNGNGFGSSCGGLSISAGSGITATCNSANNTQIQASFAISSSATGGNHAVSVTAGGQSSPSLNFFVQVPTYFIPTSSGTSLNVFCAANQAYYAYIDYQVADQIQNAISVAGLTPEESVSQNGSAYSAFKSFATPSSTTSSGTFEDIPLGTCFSVPPPPNRCIPVAQKFQILVPGVGIPLSDHHDNVAY